MGGKIWFESEYGAGTIFFIELPQKIVDKTPLSEAVEGNENKKIDIIDLSNNRVLIVDDNTLNIKVTKKLLEKYNIEVDSVKTGEDCVFKIKSGEKYNLILLDDVLPDIGGLELVNIIKNIGAFEIPPVIAYTANVMNGIREEYMAKGFDEYMPKPLDINQFDSIIKKYLKKQL
jgi:CheY-like chemotaxis protein